MLSKSMGFPPSGPDRPYAAACPALQKGNASEPRSRRSPVRRRERHIHFARKAARVLEYLKSRCHDPASSKAEPKKINGEWDRNWNWLAA